MRNLENAFRKLRSQGIVPQRTDCIIDLAAGKGRDHFTIDKFPTILACRASSRSYYATRLQRRVTLGEMMRLQGMDPGRLKLDGVSDTAVGKMIGNAMSCNVMKAICKSCLACADLQ